MAEAAAAATAMAAAAAAMAAAATKDAKPADGKAKRPAAVPFQSRVVELTTGTADWQMPRSYGKHSAGKAPLCKEHEELGWIKASEGSWLGSNKSDWPPGTTEFTITFDVTSPENAHFELQYAADNKVEGVTLNSRSLSVPSTYGQDYKTLSKLAVQTGSGLFKKGPNTLSVQVSNNGHADNPMGFYARGSLVEDEMVEGEREEGHKEKEATRKAGATQTGGTQTADGEVLRRPAVHRDRAWEKLWKGAVGEAKRDSDRLSTDWLASSIATDRSQALRLQDSVTSRIGPTRTRTRTRALALALALALTLTLTLTLP